MKRTVAMISILLVLISALSFAGGGQQKVDGNSKELKVLNYTDMTNANSAADNGWTWGTFKEKNPDVGLVIEDLFNEPFHNKTEAYAASGNLPDVLYVWPSGRSSTLHNNKLLKDLGPLIAKDNLKSVYVPMAMDPKQFGSGYVSMISLSVTSSHAFYVNLEVLNACGLQPARTYAELKAQVPVLAARGYETVLMCNAEAWVNQSCLFSMVAGRFGGADWHEKILAGTAKFTDPDFVNALAFIKTMYDDRVLAPSTLGMTYGDGPGAFATNKGAYYIDGDWRTGAFITDASTGQALITPARQANIRVTVFPDIPGAKINKSSSVILGTGWAMNAAIPAGSAREEAAWRLIKWLTGVEVQTLGLNHSAYSTAARTNINSANLTLEPIQRATANLGNEYSVGTAVFDGVFDGEIANVMNDVLMEIGLGSMTPQQGAAAVQRSFDAWRAKNPIKK